MNNNPLSKEVWGRGARLGLWWTIIFFASALILYGLLGLVGWSGVARALCAMAVGPIFALVVIVVWWMARRPTLAPTEQQPPIDPTRTQVSRRTAPLSADRLQQRKGENHDHQ